MPRRFDAADPEWMDHEQPVSDALARDLENLRFLNRWFGSYALALKFARRWIRSSREWRILDLATGSADIPREIVARARRKNIRLTVDAVDFQPSTIAIARELSAGFPEIRLHTCDIRSFGENAKWDIVLCSLALHHFSDDDAIAILRRCRELSSRFVLVSDLRRCRLGTWGVFLLTAVLLREPMTRHDGRMSTQRAFSFSELRRMAGRADWRSFGHGKFFCARQAIWLE